MLYPTLPTGMTFPNDFKLFFPYLPYFRLRAAMGGESQFYRLSNFSQQRFTLTIKPTTPAFMSVQNKVLFENCTHKWYASMFSRLQKKPARKKVASILTYVLYL